MKKITALLISVLLLALSLGFFSCKKTDNAKETDAETLGSDDDAAGFELIGSLKCGNENNVVSPGGEITFTLNFTKNAGFNVMVVTFSLPKDTFVASTGNVVEGCGLDVEFGRNIIIDAGSADSTYTGDVFSVTYTVSENAQDGEYTIGVNPDASNYDERELSCFFSDVKFEIRSEKDPAGLTGEEMKNETSGISGEGGSVLTTGESDPVITTGETDAETTGEERDPAKDFEEAKKDTFNFIWKYGYINYRFGTVGDRYYAIDSGYWGWAGLAVLLVVGYLFGSFNTAVVVSKAAFGEDIRTKGSGNAGMTNVMRTYGKKYALITFAGDMLKTVLAVLAGRLVLGVSGAFVAGLGAVIGHMWPIFFGFKGGKGVAAAFALVLMTDPIIGIVLFGLFAALVAFTKYISLGSIMCSLIYPVVLARMTSDGPTERIIKLLCAMIIAGLIVIKHWGNVKRLYAGQENKFSFKSKDKTEND